MGCGAVHVSHAQSAPFQVKELYPGERDSKYGVIPLWRSDGTEEGTVLLKDITPRTTAMGVRHFTDWRMCSPEQTARAASARDAFRGMLTRLFENEEPALRPRGTAYPPGRHASSWRPQSLHAPSTSGAAVPQAGQGGSPSSGRA